MSKWYERLTEIRSSNGLSQQELSDKLDVHLTSINRYEKGRGADSLPNKFKIKLLKVFTKYEVEYIENGGTENQLAAIFGDMGKKANAIGNTSNSSNITQNSHNGGGESGLSAEEKTLIKYFRKRDEETQEKIMAFALTGKCD